MSRDKERTLNRAGRIDELKRDIVHFGKRLYQLGYMPGMSGNLSVRLEDGRLLATPTGKSKFALQCEDLVVVDLDGRQLEGVRRVTSEIGMHVAIYRERMDVQAVVHSHPPIATAFACAGRSMDRMLCQEAVLALGTVPLASYATTGTDEVAESLAPWVAGHEAILMANHGAVTYGRDLEDAFCKMETLEHVAHIQLTAHQLGSPRTLEEEQTRRLFRARERYLQNVS